ncbi:MAG: FecR domain-containing protein [Nitrospirales bacterium]|nr:FecR domain-containing protein [Nitrospirales bacterium]
MSESVDHDDRCRENDEPNSSRMARQWIVRLASGRITAGELLQFKGWLAEDPSHRHAFERERIFWQQLERLERAEGWDQDDQEAGTQGADWRRVPIRAHSRRTAIVWALAAACLALVIVYQDIKIFLLADHRTSAGQQQFLTLPDGGLAYLNTDTAMAVTYSADERRIDLLHGEAFFDVVPNRQKPFRVMAQNGITQAVGTAFVVHAHDQQAVITVTEGTVAVSSALNNDNQLQPSVAVSKGERTTYRQGEAPRTVETVDSASAVAWIQGTIVVDGLPFAQAMAELDRYRPGRIVLLADLVHAKPVSGRFTLGGVDEAIDAFAATQGFTVLRVTDYLVFIL